MADILFRPLRAWPHKPTPTYQQKPWPNGRKITITSALDAVDDELRRMGCARRAYIEADIDEKHIRLDGELRSSATTRSPGCIIYASHRTLGELRWACDRFSKLQFNIRAIAATIEALRSVDRYGCVRDQQQFTGFKALPGEAGTTMERDAAFEILRKYSLLFLPADSTEETIGKAFLSARARVHPDRNQGYQGAWDEVIAAGKVLGVMK
jgi:hypothetical protein